MERDYSDLKVPCAALAFHKALIGIAQLKTVEEISESKTLSKLSSAKAIYTYYAAYHIFCMCILLLPEKDRIELKLPKNYGEVKDDEIDGPLETPKQWDNGKYFESDWAAKISHCKIKKFCEELRKRKKEELAKAGDYLIPLFEHFVDDTISESKCIAGLFEKLRYVRDRVIYRPSYVVTQSGRTVQTSAELGEEINSLPSAEELYIAVKEIYQRLIDGMISERQNPNEDTYLYQTLLCEIWGGKATDSLENLCKLDYPIEELRKLGTPDTGGRYSFPTHIIHLLEIESIDFILKYRELYWMPLEKMYQEYGNNSKVGGRRRDGAGI